MAAASESRHHAAHKRRVNDLIHESLQPALLQEQIGFFCECASPECYETVWATLHDYEEGRRNRGWALTARGHEREARSTRRRASAQPV